MDILKDLGLLIRKYRKMRKMTIQQLADIICKSKSTVAKYETAELNIDIATLYDIANALNIPIEALLVPQEIELNKNTLDKTMRIPEFFSKRIIYMYYWDGRARKLNTSVIHIGEAIDDEIGGFAITLYMNVKDISNPAICENTYLGKLEFYHVLVAILLRHRDNPIESAMIHILENFNANETKFGLWAGVSFRPFMPVSIKVLLSREPLAFDSDALKELYISKEDINKLKHDNMFSITQSG